MIWHIYQSMSFPGDFTINNLHVNWGRESERNALINKETQNEEGRQRNKGSHCSNDLQFPDFPSVETFLCIILQYVPPPGVPPSCPRWTSRGSMGWRRPAGLCEQGPAGCQPPAPHHRTGCAAAARWGPVTPPQLDPPSGTPANTTRLLKVSGSAFSAQNQFVCVCLDLKVQFSLIPLKRVSQSFPLPLIPHITYYIATP